MGQHPDMGTWPLRPQRSAAPLGEQQSTREECLDFATDLNAIYANREVDGERLSANELRLVSPFKRSKGRKWTSIGIACMAAIFASVAPSAYPPAEDQLAAEWHISKVAVAVGVPMFTTGFAVAPMALAPFSELMGRKPVFVVLGLVYVICTVCCGATQLYSG